MPARIMIVEDESIVAMDLENRLESLGYLVVGAANSGEEAVEKSVEWEPDVVLMDIMLNGGIDGIQAASRIRQKMNVPVVYLTAYSDDTTICRAKQTEPYGYILKPFNERDLRSNIEIALYKHKVEQKLKGIERWLATTLNSLGDGVISIDAAGLINFINPVAESVTGWSCRDAHGKHHTKIFSLIDEKTRKPIESPISQALGNGIVLQLEAGTLLQRKDGQEVPIEDTAAPVRDHAGNVTGVVVVFRDISQRKHEAEELRRIEERLRQAQKLETVGRLAGGIAHDFNNMMTVVLGQVELLSERTQDEHVLRGLQTIGHVGERAASLTRQLLAFSQKQVLHPEVVDLNVTVGKMVQMLSRLIGDDIVVSAALQQDLPHIKVDPAQIEQILMNLAVNARDAMPEGGELTIATSTRSLDAAYVAAHPGVLPGAYVVLSVIDTGCGMDAEIQANIFEPFFTTKVQGKGVGLGLATVHGIVKQSRGHIEVESKAGCGTVFKIYLPRVAGTRLRPSKSNALIPVVGKKTETVLIVDDEEILLEITQNMLETSGYAVLTACDGDTARELCRTVVPGIDLLVTDIVMPKENGPQLAASLLAIRPSLKVVFMSGYSSAAVENEGILAPNSRFIEKPFHARDLARVVRELLDS